MKSLYILGLFALLGGVAVNADSGSNEDFGFGSNEERERCYCKWNSCLGVAGTQVLGCPNTNSFRQCNAGVCTAVQACAPGQVWNVVKNACAPCDADKKLSLDQQVCLCTQGNTFNSTSQTCVSCPSLATVEPERCYCPYTHALHYLSNQCRLCPAEAPLRGRECQCTSPTLFFNKVTWTCSPCPQGGTTIPPRRGYGRSTCRCLGLNQIFREDNFSCYTCPSNVRASSDNEGCQCTRGSGMKFNYNTGFCSCPAGFAPNAFGVCAPGAVVLTP